MELLSVILGRSALIFELDSLDPFGKRSATEAIAEIQARYNFSVIPERPIDASGDKGAEFLSGRMGEIVIDKLTLFHNGIVVDTRSSTDNADIVAEDLMLAAKELLGSRVVIARRHVVSQITFRSAMRLAKMNSVLDEVCAEIERTLASDFKQAFVAEPTAVTVHTDITQTKFSPAKFTIERRVDAPFFENIYFSSAPLRTSRHLEFVEKFEKSIS